MIPKVEACLTSLEAGVRKTHIIDGRLRHSLLLEIFTQSGIGTEIVRSDNGQPTSPLPPGPGKTLISRDVRPCSLFLLISTRSNRSQFFAAIQAAGSGASTMRNPPTSTTTTTVRRSPSSIGT